MNKQMKRLGVTLSMALGFMASGVSAQQSCNSQLVATAPAAEFQINGDGTVTDNETGLMWSVCLTGQTHMFDGSCDGAPFEETWAQAHVLAAGEEIGGHSDWRLPNVNELVGVLELKCTNPAMDTTVFPGLGTASFLWTSTPTTIDGVANAVLISVGQPGPDTMTNSLPFLLVREN